MLVFRCEKLPSYLHTFVVHLQRFYELLGEERFVCCSKKKKKKKSDEVFKITIRVIAQRDVRGKTAGTGQSRPPRQYLLETADKVEKIIREVRSRASVCWRAAAHCLSDHFKAKNENPHKTCV